MCHQLFHYTHAGLLWLDWNLKPFLLILQSILQEFRHLTTNAQSPHSVRVHKKIKLRLYPHVLATSLTFYIKEKYWPKTHLIIYQIRLSWDDHTRQREQLFTTCVQRESPWNTIFLCKNCMFAIYGSISILWISFFFLNIFYNKTTILHILFINRCYGICLGWRLI